MVAVQDIRKNKYIYMSQLYLTVRNNNNPDQTFSGITWYMFTSCQRRISDPAIAIDLNRNWKVIGQIPLEQPHDPASHLLRSSGEL